MSRESECGWTARLTVDDEVAIYCPECDEREFGEVGALDEHGKVFAQRRSGISSRCLSKNDSESVGKERSSRGTLLRDIAPSVDELANVA